MTARIAEARERARLQSLTAATTRRGARGGGGGGGLHAGALLRDELAALKARRLARTESAAARADELAALTARRLARAESAAAAAAAARTGPVGGSRGGLQRANPNAHSPPT